MLPAPLFTGRVSAATTASAAIAGSAAATATAFSCVVGLSLLRTSSRARVDGIQHIRQALQPGDDRRHVTDRGRKLAGLLVLLTPHWHRQVARDHASNVQLELNRHQKGVVAEPRKENLPIRSVVNYRRARMKQKYACVCVCVGGSVVVRVVRRQEQQQRQHMM